jgi:hypothetical protein
VITTGSPMFEVLDHFMPKVQAGARGWASNLRASW